MVYSDLTGKSTRAVIGLWFIAASIGLSRIINNKISTELDINFKRNSAIAKSTDYDPKSGFYGNKKWYSDRKIEKLLEHYFKDIEDVHCYPPISSKYLDQIRNVITKIQNEKDKLSKVLVPVNLNNWHWVLFYLEFNNKLGKDRELERVCYFDPLAEPIPDAIAKYIPNLPSGAEPEKIPQKIQTDKRNCGPWLVTAARTLVANGQFPESETDINKERQTYDALFAKIKLQEGVSKDYKFEL